MGAIVGIEDKLDPLIMKIGDPEYCGNYLQESCRPYFLGFKGNWAYIG